MLNRTLTEAPTADIVTSADGRPLNIKWDHDRAELIADAVVHVIGVALALVGSILLIVDCFGAPEAISTVSVLIYAAGLTVMLVVSAAYNTWPVSRRKWLLRRFDHSAIYVLIAATYTPFIARLEATGTTALLLAGVWCAAIVGVAVKLILPGRFDRLAIGFYLVLGFSGLMVFGPAVASLPKSTLYLIVIGGVLYVTGLIFHLWERLRYQNAIWHCFVLGAAICHFLAVCECIDMPRPLTSAIWKGLDNHWTGGVRFAVRQGRNDEPEIVRSKAKTSTQTVAIPGLHDG